MKSTLQILSVLMFFVSIPLSLYQGYLMYTHIHATELMWLIYVINIPVIILSTTISFMLNRATK